MIIVGLTGSIATGKSETGRMFHGQGVPVLEADTVVHDLYAKGGAAVRPVAALVPESCVDGAIQRARLATALQKAPDLLVRLEAIVHPLVRRAQTAFVENAIAAGHRLVVLDIPLLLEKGRGTEVDKIVVTTCNPALQRARALARPGMTVEKFAWILARQMPDAEKRVLADYVIDTGEGLEAARRRVEAIIEELAGAASHA